MKYSKYKHLSELMSYGKCCTNCEECDFFSSRNQNSGLCKVVNLYVNNKGIFRITGTSIQQYAKQIIKKNVLDFLHNNKEGV